MFREKFLSNLYTQLLTVLIFLAIASSFISNSLGKVILSFILVVFIYIIIHSLVSHKKIYQFAYLSLAVLTLSSQILIETQPEFLGRPFLIIIVGIINLSFLGLAIYIIGKKISQTERVTDDILKGGICIYFLLGIWFGFWYDMIYYLDKTSFYIISFNEQPVYFQPIYYSFVTLTTLGYGDIVPVSRIAKNSAVLEATLGVLYVAISVSRLVSLFISDEINRRN
ncbi:hypothetical protein C7H19_04905 [Aphanothece hegewaldii CCALA 016]|uniref:Potassium channel domain-containing protein n=1 Tax=Aphanothece hegewaldii CCALA 016 TaxID=2107694 RepID=A0A2T1M0Y1_9CHRO|nr:potassium channel family protein [Aphanothece hegewaldii]PSF38336.1 hypothetical protein C7H19_04905 [Aphanothece hegewaldii CCALA 016]